ncbi:uncharacterized protein LOC133526492 isoform X1 [Cydia pomonella]|uniref:uncharacterized protein LOC133526492 isoform X1 n=1 Tax=Cydia pomonella TaxID=82600 RepID=UPI002ADE7112|nr:uncharacterized protein LOC133526492 isoform X1 [Cydia pomonella]
MPKYYRFRATTPTRKVRQIKEKDIKREVQNRPEHPYNLPEDILGLTLVCAAPSWYLRRTAWREGPTIAGPLRQLSSVAGRAVFIVKPSW